MNGQCFIPNVGDLWLLPFHKNAKAKVLFARYNGTRFVQSQTLLTQQSSLSAQNLSSAFWEAPQSDSGVSVDDSKRSLRRGWSRIQLIEFRLFWEGHVNPQMDD
jgi:hypothetical protein